MGDLITLLTVLKGLPLAYGKDMQEDKEPVFDAESHLSVAIAAMTGMIEDLVPNADAMRAALKKGHPTATDLADYLVREKGIAFREAHHITGALVAKAEEKQLALEELPIADITAIAPMLDDDVLTILSVDVALNARNSEGGTAPARVAEQIDQACIAYGLKKA